MRSKLLPVCIACATLASMTAWAQDYPAANKTITFVLPYAAGGPTDKGGAIALELRQIAAPATRRQHRVGSVAVDDVIDQGRDAGLAAQPPAQGRAQWAGERSCRSHEAYSR